ncbi:MAG: hypothetical protein JWL66_2478 [Sphingomonadales bacterium]|nr:hypothetical protein [Sphingomonadales bacterium]
MPSSDKALEITGRKSNYAPYLTCLLIGGVCVTPSISMDFRSRPLMAGNDATLSYLQPIQTAQYLIMEYQLRIRAGPPIIVFAFNPCVASFLAEPRRAAMTEYTSCADESLCRRADRGTPHTVSHGVR